jgi:hypothetical protein
MNKSSVWLLSIFGSFAATSCAAPADDSTPQVGTASEAVAVDPGDGETGRQGPVSAPTGVSLVSTAFDRVSVKFTCGRNADSHSLVETSSGGGEKWVANIGCAAGQVRTLTDYRVEPGKTYCWSVVAANTTHEARSGARCALVPLDLGPVAAPGLTVSVLSANGLRFVIEDKSTNEGGFRIQGRRVGTPVWQSIHTVMRSTRSDRTVGLLPRVDDHRFSPDESWEFYAEAFKEYAPAQAASAVVRAQLLPLAVTAPQNVRIVSSEEHAMTVAWDPVPNASNYRIHTAVSADFDPDDVVISASETRYRIASLPAGYNVCVTVTAMNRANEASSSSACGKTVYMPPTSTDHTSDLTLSAAPPILGLLPFVGSFPAFGMLTGTVRSIELPSAANPSSLLALTFIAPGASTSACTDPDASVAIRPGERLDAAGLEKLYGTATPALPLAIKACAAGTSQQVPSPLVRIRWFGY